MRVIILREYGKNETKGSLLVASGHAIAYRCKTLELPDNDNQHYTSCIPEGTYETIKFDSPKHGPCFLLLNVPSRDSIEIHPGNYVSGSRVDTLGCILPGSCFVDINDDGNIDVADSRKTMNELLAILPDKFNLIII